MKTVEATATARKTTTKVADWLQANQGIAIIVAFVLLFLYVLPIYMIGIATLVTGGFQEPNFLLSWFGAFMKSADSTLSQYHKVLLPVIAALSTATFRDRANGRLLWLGFFVVFSYCVTIVVSVLFDMKPIQDALSAQEGVVDLHLSNQFFVRIQETLLMYLMMLMGIGVSNSRRN